MYIASLRVWFERCTNELKTLFESETKATNLTEFKPVKHCLKITRAESFG